MLNSISANGMICRSDGSEDFLLTEGGDYVIQQAKKAGNIIWGRQAYDNVKKNLQRFDDALIGVKRVILSRNKDLQIAEGYELVNSPREAINLLTSLNMKVAILDGGSSINTSFLNENLVDEVHLLVEPMLIGGGLSVVAEATKDIKLELISVEHIHENNVLLKYRVVN